MIRQSGLMTQLYDSWLAHRTNIQYAGHVCRKSSHRNTWKAKHVWCMCKKVILICIYIYTFPHSTNHAILIILYFDQHDICSDICDLFREDHLHLRPSPLHYLPKNQKAILKNCIFLYQLYVMLNLRMVILFSAVLLWNLEWWIVHFVQMLLFLALFRVVLLYKGFLISSPSDLALCWMSCCFLSKILNGLF